MKYSVKKPKAGDMAKKRGAHKCKCGGSCDKCKKK